MILRAQMAAITVVEIGVARPRALRKLHPFCEGAFLFQFFSVFLKSGIPSYAILNMLTKIQRKQKTKI